MNKHIGTLVKNTFENYFKEIFKHFNKKSIKV